MKHHRIGFSSGALAFGDYQKALSWLLDNEIYHVELSALRFHELRSLVMNLDTLPLDKFQQISFHAPSSFSKEEEPEVISLLLLVRERGWNIVVHPDVIYKYSDWRCFGDQLLLENMDSRKHIGKTTECLASLFKKLPEARLCLDVAHAVQIDQTFGLLSDLMDTFSDRIAEIHISELDNACRHQPMSEHMVNRYKMWMEHIDEAVPVVIESMLTDSSRQRKNEYYATQQVFQRPLAAQMKDRRSYRTCNKH